MLVEIRARAMRLARGLEWPRRGGEGLVEHAWMEDCAASREEDGGEDGVDKRIVQHVSKPGAAANLHAASRGALALRGLKGTARIDANLYAIHARMQ